MIEILMATYNAERFLRAQLDSILNQTNQDWKLIVRDDCSSDNTVEILQEYQEREPDRIQLIQSEHPSGSAQNNFFWLMQYWKKHGQADYAMFADQDDVWLEEKIECTIEKMHWLEGQYGTEIPLLVHTDLAVVDEALSILNNSLFDMHNMDSNRNQLNNILVQNIVTGCTVMINRSLIKMVCEIPKHAVMHDMWLALIAAAFGHIGFIDRATMLYRQHGQNVKGAQNMKSAAYLLKKIAHLQDVHSGLVEQYKQAAEFLRIYDVYLNAEQKEMLYAYSTFEEKNAVSKYKALKKYALYKKGFVRKLGQILL
ncbi:MAG: glycosyltransferase family 2 protein [Peptococcaceae bacterium]|nr:glycosyltransferase family 2 protein [Peptococcaceae bacterium]MBQ2994947.1 glycosyltransferase family 2 protein [Peptococcaceae bacterium]